MNNSECNQRVRIMIMWGDHSIESCHSATDVLQQVCGGWNPPHRASTTQSLRKALQIVTID